MGEGNGGRGVGREVLSITVSDRTIEGTYPH